MVWGKFVEAGHVQDHFKDQFLQIDLLSPTHLPYENGTEYAPKTEYAPTKIGQIGAFSSLIESEYAPYQYIRIWNSVPFGTRYQMILKL